MKFQTTVVIGLCVLALQGCPSKTEQKSTPADTVSTDESTTPSIVPETHSEDISPELLPGYDIIQYSGASDDNVKNTLEVFSPMSDIFAATTKIIELESRIYYSKEDGTEMPDTSFLDGYRSAAYQAILDYKQTMEADAAKVEACPSLLALMRETNEGDSTASILTVVKSSTLLTHGNFFFFGGRPFISKSEPDDNSIYTDPQGKPETRFTSQLNENANYLMTSLYHFKRPQISITFGQASTSNDGYHRVNIRGIRSIIHTFKQRVPVFFLTDDGLVPASLISCTIKIGPEGVGCESDQPSMEFACPKNLEADDILAVYIPFDEKSVIKSCAVSHPNNKLWTADLDNDGTPDIACVAGLFVGGISDTMAEVLWFVNINGTWKIIDEAHDLDCT